MLKGIHRKLTVFSANMAYQRRKLFYPQSAKKQRAMIVKAVKAAGAAGLTRDQIVVTTGIPLQSVTWRTRELLRQHSLGETQYAERETRQGGIAKVLFAA